MMKRTLFPSLLLALTGFGCAPADVSSPDPEVDVVFAAGKADESGFDACTQEKIVAHVNDFGTSVDSLKADGVHTRAARNLIAQRDGFDMTPGTADDSLFADIYEIDKVSWVGPAALRQLAAIVEADCAAPATPATDMDVIFSPQPFERSHLAKAIELIGGAERSLDIAMYSFSDGRVLHAIEDAIDRGVIVRVVYNGALDHKSDPAGTMSARIEEAGADVRYINKIMHNKFVIIDGPQEDVAHADTAWLMSGSGNWSTSAGTRYDENTIVTKGHRELNLRFQREFNLLWENSRDLAWSDYDYWTSEQIDETDLEHDDNVDAYFTSTNFRTYVSSRYGNTFGRVRGRAEIANQLVSLIEGATESIKIASGHLRSKPVADALIAAVQANPDLNVMIYLDGQEFVSEYTHEAQLDNREDCLADAAGSATRTEDCYNRGFLYAYAMVQEGMDVRFKHYSYRWHYSYAVQMHHKYLIIDDSIVATGSYNLSDNAEVNTMENVVVVNKDAYPAFVQSFVDNFHAMWDTGRDGTLYDDLMEDVLNGSDPFPIVYDSMALTWDEVDTLKRAMRDACPAINTESFRRNPQRHFICVPN